MTKLQKTAALCAIMLAAGLASCGEATTQENTEETAAATAETTTTTAAETTAPIETTTTATEEPEAETTEAAEEPEPEYADEEPVDLGDLARSGDREDEILYRLWLDSIGMFDKYGFDNLECVFGGYHYRRPVYRTGLAFIPEKQFYIDILWKNYTINGDNIVFQQQGDVIRAPSGESITIRYLDEARLFVLYDIDDAVDLLPEDRFNELKNENINWVIVRPHYVSNVPQTVFQLPDNRIDFFDEIYGDYIYGDNIILEWHDDWFERYADIWWVLKKYPFDEMDEDRYNEVVRSYGTDQ